MSSTSQCLIAVKADMKVPVSAHCFGSSYLITHLLNYFRISRESNSRGIWMSGPEPVIVLEVKMALIVAKTCLTYPPV